MWTVKLKKVGGSVMVVIPPEVRNQLGLGPNRSVTLSLDKGKIIMNPRLGRIGLAARLKMSDFSLPPSDEGSNWMRVGEGRSPASKSTQRSRRKTDRNSSKTPRGKSRGPW